MGGKTGLQDAAAGFTTGGYYTLGKGIMNNTSMPHNAGNMLGGLTGTGGGISGTGLPGPQQAPIVSPVTPEGVTGAQAGADQSLASQQALLQALQNQGALNQQNVLGDDQRRLVNALATNNAVQNQRNVFENSQNLAGALASNDGAGNMQNAQLRQQTVNDQLANAGGIGAQTGALGQQQLMNNALAGGINTQNSAVQGLQGLAGQYQNIAAGNGPNPAMAALHNATGQNIANQAALMASQRGAGANIGLLGRQAAMQGAGIQQQAAGQGAEMQAQQQLNALNSQLGVQQAIGGLGTSQAQLLQQGIGQQANIGSGLTTAQQTGLNAQSAQAAQQVAQQQAQQQMLAAQAQNQVANQQGALNSAANQANIVAGQNLGQVNTNAQASLANAGQQQQAATGYNNAVVNSQGNVNSANSALAQTQMQGQQKLIGGAMNSAGSVLSSLAEGGEVENPEPQPMAAVPINPMPTQGPQSSFGQFLVARDQPNNLDPTRQPQFDPAVEAPDPQSSGGGSGGGGGIGSLVGAVAAMAAKGGQVSDYRTGGHVKAKSKTEKAVKAGDSYANDKVKAVLSEGEVVIPRSVMQSKDPVRGAADFVAKVLARKRVS